MQKAKHGYTELLLVSALFVGACAGAQATNGAPSGPFAVGMPAASPPAQGDASCPAEPVAITEVRPLVDKYCVSCHSPNGAAGEDYDFTSDGAVTARRRNIEAKLRLHAMPPPNVHQPSDAERMILRCWAKG